jgi:DnaK suppressor protein
MSKTELKKYKTTLESKEAELAARLRNRDGIAIEKTADALDEVQYAGERELAIRSLHRESTLLRMVRAALARLAGGTYGACLHCDEEISTRRLTAAPWSTYCLKCQEAADRREFEVVDVPDSFIADAA